MLKVLKDKYFIRGIGYGVLIIGVLSIFFEFGPVFLSEYKYQLDQLLSVKHHLSRPVITSAQVSGNQIVANSSVSTSNNNSSNQGSVSFGDIGQTDSLEIVPVSTDYGIVIEKIDANSRVIADVDPSNTSEYTKALAEGVAATKGSTAPGEPGNLYIFSHSVDAPWNVIRYNAIFYLLRKLEVGDRVVMFYKGRRYDYIVFDKTIVNPTDLSYLTNRYDKPVLTLQTCDPPGTLLHRLIVRAKLEST